MAAHGGRRSMDFRATKIRCPWRLFLLRVFLFSKWCNCLKPFDGFRFFLKRLRLLRTWIITFCCFNVKNHPSTATSFYLAIFGSSTHTHALQSVMQVMVLSVFSFLPSTSSSILCANGICVFVEFVTAQCEQTSQYPKNSERLKNRELARYLTSSTHILFYEKSESRTWIN